MRAEDRRRGAQKARSVARELGLSSPTLGTIDSIAFARGAVVMNEPIKGALARLLRTDTRAIIVVADHLKDGPRRFAVAHELGHLELHQGQDALAGCVDRDLRDRSTSREGEANSFAVELLMPQGLFEQKCDVRQPSLDAVRKLSGEFQVSLTAAALRFAAFSPEPCAVVLSEKHRICWAIPGPDFQGCPVGGALLRRGTLADKLFDGRGPYSEPHEVSPELWLDDSLDCELHEDSTSTGGGRVLTLLWQRLSEPSDDDEA